MEPLSMNTLASSLPSAQQQAQANDLSAKFKDAALAITTLYRASTAAQKRAHNAGYSAALQDILAFIRGGLSDGAVMDVGTVMDYAEGRASAIADDDEEDAPAPPPVAPKVQSRLGNKAAASPQTITQSTTLSAKENRRRKHSSASPSPPPSAIAPMPISVATSVSAPTPGKMKLQDSSRAPSPVVGMKRRHQSTLADNLGFGFGMSNTLQPTNGEPSQRIKKGKPKSSRVPNPAIPPVATLFGLGVEEDMDVEEERPRKRR